MTRLPLRVRLAAVYTGLFLATSVLLLVAVNLLLAHDLKRATPRFGGPVYGPTDGPAAPAGNAPPGGRSMTPDEIAAKFAALRSSVLREQWIISAGTVVVMALVSVTVGWWLAGRLLRPLHRITATARRLSLSNLHERIALSGPRDELTELADTFDTMLERLQHAADTQRRFVANASHELRTPLAIQRTALEVGLADPSPERLAEVRAELLAANRRHEQLIEGLLLLAQSERGERGLVATVPVSLDALVRQVVAEQPAPGITVTVHAEPATVSGDPPLLGRLVANLVHNAIRYNRPGGTVEIRCTASGLLTVRNTGPHVPADRIPELFEPFRRLHPARTRSARPGEGADGAGLGLSIAATIARAHQATLTARPNPGGGLELTIQFPATTPN